MHLIGDCIAWHNIGAQNYDLQTVFGESNSDQCVKEKVIYPSLCNNARAVSNGIGNVTVDNTYTQ